MVFEQFRILETNNPKLRLTEVQWGVDELPIVTLETVLTQEFIDWLKSDGGVDKRFIDKLERILNANQPIR